MVSTKRLRAIRKERGMPLSELARRSGVSRQTLTRIELHGHVPGVEIVFSIAAVLGKRVEDIFFDQNATHV